MDFESVDDVLLFAIEKEQEAAAFYREAAKSEIQEAAKTVFLDFAKEEDKHEQMIKDFMADKSSIANYQFKKLDDLKRSDYMMDMEYKPGLTYFEIMRIAMKREEKSYKLYQNLSQSAESEELASLFSVLANEELKHKNGLERIYDDYLAERGD